MKNYVQPGNTITVTAPAQVGSGDGVLIGAIFGVAAGAAANGAPLELTLVGVFDLPKEGAQAWTPGDRVYWDDPNKRTTKTVAGHTLIGVAVDAVGGGPDELVGRVRLNGAF